MRFRNGTSRSTVVLVVVANLLCFGPVPAAGQTQQQLELCGGEDARTPGLIKDRAILDLRIASCTALIQSGKFSGEKLAEFFITRGQVLSMSSDLDRALADFNDAVRLAPQSAFALHMRGHIYFRKKDYVRAIADLDEAIRLDPSFADAWFERGTIHRGKDDIDRAIADWNEAIRLNPKYVSAIYGRGFAYQVKGEYDRAIVDYTEVIRLGTLHFPWVFVYRGNAHFSKKDFDKAIADYEVALKIDPKHAGALYSRGMSKKRKGIPGGDADIAAAKAIQAGIAKQFEYYGVK
ncbi:MAG: tetratricopeptide repeat protein [Reyranella sp.]